MRLADAPIPGRTGHTAVWSGEEVVVWGGRATDRRSGDVTMSRDGGMRREFATATWTGDRVVYWGGARARDSRRPELDSGYALVVD